MFSYIGRKEIYYKKLPFLRKKVKKGKYTRSWKKKLYQIKR